MIKTVAKLVLTVKLEQLKNDNANVKYPSNIPNVYVKWLQCVTAWYILPGSYTDIKLRVLSVLTLFGIDTRNLATISHCGDVYG